MIATQERETLSWYSGKRVLITGGGGFIGSAIIRLLADTNCRIDRLLRRPAPTWRHPTTAKVQDVVGDVCDAALWQEMPDDLDVVFHLAAQTSTYEANRYPLADVKANALPLLSMLQSFQERKLFPAVIFASTATISGLPKVMPVNEDQPDAPVTIYDLHKRMAESYLEYFVRNGTARGAALRLANVYGPGPNSINADRGILNKMVKRALGGEELTVYGQGNQLRDYVHVEDVASAFLAAAANVDVLRNVHYVIGKGEGYTIFQALRLVADRVAARTGQGVAVNSVEPPKGLSPIEERNFVADPRRFAELTGWLAHYSLAEGIDTILESLI